MSQGTEHGASQTPEACLGWEGADNPPAGKCTPCSVPPAAKGRVRNSLSGQTKGRGRRDLLTHCLKQERCSESLHEFTQGGVGCPAGK